MQRTRAGLLRRLPSGRVHLLAVLLFLLLLLLFVSTLITRRAVSPALLLFLFLPCAVPLPVLRLFLVLRQRSHRSRQAKASAKPSCVPNTAAYYNIGSQKVPRVPLNLFFFFSYIMKS